MKYLKPFKESSFQLYDMSTRLLPHVTPSENSKSIARYIAEFAIRNTLEKFHEGITPSSNKKDYSDVKVVTPYGEIPWNELSRISDKEMRELMLVIEGTLSKVVELLYRVGTDKKMEKEFQEIIKKAYKESGVSWDRKNFNKGS